MRMAGFKKGWTNRSAAKRRSATHAVWQARHDPIRPASLRQHDVVPIIAAPLAIRS
jgi:hypothetical protein